MDDTTGSLGLALGDLSDCDNGVGYTAVRWMEVIRSPELLPRICCVGGL